MKKKCSFNSKLPTQTTQDISCKMYVPDSFKECFLNLTFFCTQSNNKHCGFIAKLYKSGQKISSFSHNHGFSGKMAKYLVQVTILLEIHKHIYGRKGKLIFFNWIN